MRRCQEGGSLVVEEETTANIINSEWLHIEEQVLAKELLNAGLLLRGLPFRARRDVALP